MSEPSDDEVTCFDCGGPHVASSEGGDPGWCIDWTREQSQSPGSERRPLLPCQSCGSGVIVLDDRTEVWCARCVMDELADLRTRLTAALARAEEAERKIGESAFNCPGCGRHDFGLFAGPIKEACGPCRDRAEKAEADRDHYRGVSDGMQEDVDATCARAGRATLRASEAEARAEQAEAALAVARREGARWAADYIENNKDGVRIRWDGIQDWERFLAAIESYDDEKPPGDPTICEGTHPESFDEYDKCEKCGGAPPGDTTGADALRAAWAAHKAKGGKP